MKLTVTEVFSHPAIISRKSFMHPCSSELSIYHQKATFKLIIQNHLHQLQQIEKGLIKRKMVITYKSQLHVKQPPTVTRLLLLLVHQRQIKPLKSMPGHLCVCVCGTPNV